MKFLKLSLAASVALGALSTASFAQSLEEAIKGVDVSGYLRYRYTDDRLNDDYRGSKPENARHQWKALADFKTEAINNVAVNLGVLYDNENIVNHGKEPNGQSDLKQNSDDSFEVRTFYATITPDSTATTVTIGKQLINTPVTSADDNDRGTGIAVMNNDINGLTLAAIVYDAWALEDAADVTPNDDKGYAKNLYGLGGVYNLETSFGNLGFQLWGFNVTDAVDALVFGEGSWKNDFLRAKLQYTFAALNNDEDSILTSDVLAGGFRNGRADIAAENDLATIELGANFANFGVPLDVRLGYMMNFMDGVAVTLNDDSANFSKAGKIWYDDPTVGFSPSIFKGIGYATPLINETDAKVLYGAFAYSMVDDRLKLGLEAAYGNVERTADRGATDNASDKDGQTVSDVKFFEVTPTISWKHSDKLNLSAFYAYLTAEQDDKAGGSNFKPSKNGTFDYDRQRVRFEAKYSF